MIYVFLANIRQKKLIAKKKLKVPTRVSISLYLINTLAYPHVANTFDSLAEAYQKDGQIDLAILNYEKVLELEPENEGVRKALKELFDMEKGE